jgi:hypothetical protein
MFAASGITHAVQQPECRYLKHEIFSSYNLIALASDGLIGINCGIVYGQNAHPAGPTAWAAFQVPDRTFRWLDDQEYILTLLNSTSSPGKLQDIGFEQSVFNDAVWSTVSGQPFFAHSMRPPDDSDDKMQWEDFHASIGPNTVQREEVRCCAPCSSVMSRCHSHQNEVGKASPATLGAPTAWCI